MNFFESLMEGIEDNYEVEVGTGIEIDADLNVELEAAEFEQGMEVMEANKFLATTRLAGLELEKACLEAELSELDSFFLGESVLANAKDKVLELWERFKEWVQGILAKVKVFFAKFAISRKQIAQLDIQLEKARNAGAKFTSAKKHIGVVDGMGSSKLGAMKTSLGAISVVSTSITKGNVESLKKSVEKVLNDVQEFEGGVKKSIEDSEFTTSSIQDLHKQITTDIGSFVKGLEASLKAANEMQRKHDRLGRGNDPKIDSDAVAQVRGLITAGNRAYAAGIKLFFAQVRLAKNIISYVGKDAKMDKDETKDTGKMRGMAKF